MSAYLEHANLHVARLDAMLDFILTALPEFRVRHDSGEYDPQRWVHVGDEHSYLALYQASVLRQGSPDLYSGAVQINHLGFVVDDVESVRTRLLQRGYRETTISNDHPTRARRYFLDAEGNEWEFVQYLSSDPVQRNDYLR